jgi:hypothetical protein
MRAAATYHTRPNELSRLTFALRVGLLFFPAVLIAPAALRTTGRPQLVLGLGVAVQLVLCVLGWPHWRRGQRPLSPLVMGLYLVALGWLWVGSGSWTHWYLYLAEGLLLLIPLTVFALQMLIGSGAPALRRARLLSQALADRQEWPAELLACRDLPEVQALREALHLDATPALNLLRHPRPEVRMAALASLEFRRHWRTRQAEYVLRVGRLAADPALRAAAVRALANVEDRLQVEALAEFLHEGDPGVRQAAAEALFADLERRWPWIRHSIRQALASTEPPAESLLGFQGRPLPAEAVADLNAWAAEKGLLAVRAAQVLGHHYSRLFQEKAEDTLLRQLAQQVADPHAPPALRLELARVLKNLNQWETPLLEGLLASANPAPLRLLAAEALLGVGPHELARQTVYDIARLPNREIALATAEVIQRCLGVDLGLPLGQPLPPAQSRQAAEITRRVLRWAAVQGDREPRKPADRDTTEQAEELIG